MRFIAISIVLLFVTSASFAQVPAVNKSDKARVVIVTDLGGEDPARPGAFDPDDTQSMIHLLVCMNVVDVEAIVSGMAWTSEPNRTSYIFDLWNNVEKVIPNLQAQAEGFPSIDYLRSITKQGPLKAHMDAVGEGMDTAGSDFIIECVDRDDPRPIWLTTWCGSAAIAQALWKVKNTRSEEELAKFISKIRIYDVLGQDNCGSWIAANFPDVIYLRNNKVYGWVPSDDWFKTYVQSVKPLGDYYPTRIWTWEGDTVGFMYFLANGLNDFEHWTYGGWGGRFTSDKHANEGGMGNRNSDFSKWGTYYMYVSEPEGIKAVNLFNKHILNDFIARMQWSSTSDFKAVNHHPVAAIGKDKSLKTINKDVLPGTVLPLDASASSDIDGNKLSYRYWVYSAPGTYKGSINMTMDSLDSPKVYVNIPEDASGKNFHIILEVTDNGTPALTSYRRIVVNVK